MDKKLQWEKVYEQLKDVLDLVQAMNEKPTVQAQLMNLIDTAKVQAKLWEAPEPYKYPTRLRDI